MTDKCIYVAKSCTTVPLEWVIVETASRHYEEEADIYIHEPVKTTPNKSVNAGFKAVTGEYVIFLANDVFVEDGWVECMLECFERFADCGIATLGNNEHGDIRHDEIIERIYFSVCMFRRKDAWLDDGYDDLFDDSDLIMRVYVSGKKSYKNTKCLVTHLRHQTYGPPDLGSDKSISQRDYFRRKWQGHSHLPIYKLFA